MCALNVSNWMYYLIRIHISVYFAKYSCNILPFIVNINFQNIMHLIFSLCTKTTITQIKFNVIQISVQIIRYDVICIFNEMIMLIGILPDKYVFVCVKHETTCFIIICRKKTAITCIKMTIVFQWYQLFVSTVQTRH